VASMTQAFEVVKDMSKSAFAVGKVLLFGILLTTLVFTLVDDMRPNSAEAIAASLRSDTRDAELVDTLTKTMTDAAPLVPAEEVIPCMDVDQPGVIIGRFCRSFEASHVNLRVTKHIPVMALRQLPNLTRIEALGSRWPSLDPLIEFNGITWLDLTDASIGNFDALPRFTKLETLSLSESNFNTFSHIAGMAELTTLGLSDLPIADLSPLAAMNKMESLYLKGTEITDLAPLSHMSRLRVLDIRDTSVTDLSALEGISGLAIHYGPSQNAKTQKY